MSEPVKRKIGGNGVTASRGPKRNKGGSGGKWQTPHRKAKSATHHGGGKIESGDVGIWATCVKGKESRAIEELKSLFEEYAERIYGIIPKDNEDEKKADEEDDIEASIRREVNSMANKEGLAQLFTPIYLDLQCVLFFKTTPPIVPVDFAQEICLDARDNSGKRRTRFVNRLTPMTIIGKATEKGLEEVGRKVLRAHFQLVEAEKDQDPRKAEGCHASYAIRPTIRNHSALKRDVVIKLVASLVGPNHKVDLTKPDKVIIVEIYQNICGMSVIGSAWDILKRFNLAELYQATSKPATQTVAKAENAVEGTAEDESKV